MIVDADRLGSTSVAAGDWRITPIGRFLRRHKLDELPQLTNVLRGEMSLVGPRPEVPEYVSTYTAVEQRVLTVRPGLTDWASLWNFDEGGTLAKADDPDQVFESVILPGKLRLQVYYIEHRSLLMDLKLVLYTCVKLFRRQWDPVLPLQMPLDHKPLKSHFERHTD